MYRILRSWLTFHVSFSGFCCTQHKLCTQRKNKMLKVFHFSRSQFSNVVPIPNFISLPPSLCYLLYLFISQFELNILHYYAACCPRHVSRVIFAFALKCTPKFSTYSSIAVAEINRREQWNTSRHQRLHTCKINIYT